MISPQASETTERKPASRWLGSLLLSVLLAGIVAVFLGVGVFTVKETNRKANIWNAVNRICQVIWTQNVSADNPPPVFELRKGELYVREYPGADFKKALTDVDETLLLTNFCGPTDSSPIPEGGGDLCYTFEFDENQGAPPVKLRKITVRKWVYH